MEQEILLSEKKILAIEFLLPHTNRLVFGWILSHIVSIGTHSDTLCVQVAFPLESSLKGGVSIIPPLWK